MTVDKLKNKIIFLSKERGVILNVWFQPIKMEFPYLDCSRVHSAFSFLFGVLKKESRPIENKAPFWVLLHIVVSNQKTALFF